MRIGLPLLALAGGLLVGWLVLGWWLWPVQWTEALALDLGPRTGSATWTWWQNRTR